jgi:hypothetical protein
MHGIARVPKNIFFDSFHRKQVAKHSGEGSTELFIEAATTDRYLHLCESSMRGRLKKTPESETQACMSFDMDE